MAHPEFRELYDIRAFAVPQLTPVRPEEVNLVLSLAESPATGERYVAKVYIAAASTIARNGLLERIHRAGRRHLQSRFFYPGDDGVEHVASILAARPVHEPRERSFTLIVTPFFGELTGC